ncbi:hypothetical protein BJ742DRAFT_175117 [Cladochytrium replicatum]|nr:hypothetical protein BJ742DRAFT_175117 [Cladochytrium replicatum]
MEVFLKNPLFVGVRIPEIGKVTTLEQKLPHISNEAMSWLKQCLIYDPEQRATTKQLMAHPYFQSDGFADRFEIEVRHTIDMEREKEQTDRTRRKKARKHHESSRISMSKKDLRTPFEDIDSNVADRKRSDDDKMSSQSLIPPIQQGKYFNQTSTISSFSGHSGLTGGGHGGLSYSSNSYGQSGVAGGNVMHGVHGVNTGPSLVSLNGSGMNYSGASAPFALPPPQTLQLKGKKSMGGCQQTISFPKIMSGTSNTIAGNMGNISKGHQGSQWSQNSPYDE